MYTLAVQSHVSIFKNDNQAKVVSRKTSVKYGAERMVPARKILGPLLLGVLL